MRMTILRITNRFILKNIFLGILSCQILESQSGVSGVDFTVLREIRTMKHVCAGHKNLLGIKDVYLSDEADEEGGAKRRRGK